MGGGKQTVGYWYGFDIHMGWGRGPVDELVEIKVGDKTAWAGSVTENTDIRIIKPGLFGGEKREGGINGVFTVLMGAPNQTVSAKIKNALGGLVPDFRGVAGGYFSGWISANNPYPKPWKFRINRALKGWHNDDPWYPAKAKIGMADGQGNPICAMNPAHIVYQCLTDPLWGRGLPPSRLDEESFISAANVLCAEQFGMCIAWRRQDGLDAFVQSVLDHIGGALFIDRGTGLLTLKLIRADYDPEDLPLFTYDSGLLEVEDMGSGAAEAVPNEIVAKFHDPVTDTEGQVRVQNLASRQATGAVVSETNDYPGIPTASLALRVALRDLKVRSGGLKRYRLTLDRRGWKLQPAGVFRFSAPDKGVADMVVRIGRIDIGDPADGRMTVEVVQDVFALPDTSFVAEQGPAWTPPDSEAAAVETWRTEEITYRDLVRTLSPAELDALPDDAGAVAVLAARPTPEAVNYVIASRVDSDSFSTKSIENDWTPHATLRKAVGPYDTALKIKDVVDVGEFVEGDGTGVEIGSAAQIEGEIVRVEAIDTEAGTLTVARGCADTIPESHPAGSIVWFRDDYVGLDGEEYVDGDEVDVKALTRTNIDTLDVDTAPTNTVTIDRRPNKPYAPGDLRVNGFPALVQTGGLDDLVITWTHRDRLTQADQLVDHGASDVGPEASVTYTLRIYDAVSDTLLRTEDGISGNTFTYTSEMATTDGWAELLRVELEAVRDEVSSHAVYSILVAHPDAAGYGNAYGLSYGDA